MPPGRPVADDSPSARALATEVATGHRSAHEVVTDSLTRIAVMEPQVHALLHVDSTAAVRTARYRDRTRLSGRPPGPLAGVPVVVKDNIAVRGMPMTCGSRALDGHHPARDAVLVRRLRSAGAIVLGKSNLDEFAMGASTQTSAFGPTRNPRDLTRTPGGSSGGSTAAVAAGEVPLAVGTDTGGSVREPAAQCGVVGVKPSWGSVPTSGVVPFAPSLDQPGPVAATVLDTALLHQVMAGPSADFVAAAADGSRRVDLRGQRVGVVAEMTGPRNQSGVLSRFDDAVGLLLRLGAEVVEVAVPSTADALGAYYVVSSYEALATLTTYARDGLLGDEAMQRLEQGRAIAADPDERRLAWAWGVVARLRAEVATALGQCTLLTSPTLPVTAPRLGNQLDDPLAVPRTDCWTVLANLTGIPALSLPYGVSPDDGLPVGIQLMSGHGDDARLYRVAASVEAAAPRDIRAFARGLR